MQVFRPPPAPTNERVERAFQTIRSLARVFLDKDGAVPPSIDPRYAWAIKTIFDTADDALTGKGRGLR